jgi:glycosyltransferase involved in cell wall biosynthesis
VLIPTAHDEDAFYFDATKRLFGATPNIFVNSKVERDLIVKNYPQTAPKISIVGLGFDEDILVPNPTHSLYELPVHEAYLLYLGRIGYGKHVDRLISYFQAYRKQNPDTALKLVLAGYVESDFRMPSDPSRMPVVLQTPRL